MGREDENAGYYCPLIAIFCGLGATEAQKLYEYGPEHPVCRKIRKKKLRLPETGGPGKKDAGQLMRKFLGKGYTVNAVAEAFGCYPSTVRRKVREVGGKE